MPWQSWLPLLLFLGLPLAAKLLSKLAQSAQAKREEMERQAKQDAGEIRMIRAGRDPSRDAVEAVQPPAESQAQPGRPARGDLAQRRRIVMEELRRRQQMQASAGQAPVRRPTTPQPAAPPTPQRIRPVAVRGGFRQGQAVDDLHVAESTRQRDKQRTRRQDARAPKRPVRAKPSEQQMQGLHVRLNSVDEHYVVYRHGIGVERLRFDAQSIRQALVMAELLAPPLAMREPADPLDTTAGFHTYL
ncbi:MAG: hypothetical protein KAS72_04475 [Phycisphaerales bacterium]|nr:hypothetical protein [Phycisphaerales bacterium]